MNDTKQISCSCAACSGQGCLCGCQQPAAQPLAQTNCACGPQCKWGASCTCAKS